MQGGQTCSRSAHTLSACARRDSLSPGRLVVAYVTRHTSHVTRHTLPETRNPLSNKRTIVSKGIPCTGTQQQRYPLARGSHSLALARVSRLHSSSSSSGTLPPDAAESAALPIFFALAKRKRRVKGGGSRKTRGSAPRNVGDEGVVGALFL
jgi:hypothetical protein